MVCEGQQSESQAPISPCSPSGWPRPHRNAGVTRTGSCQATAQGGRGPLEVTDRQTVTSALPEARPGRPSARWSLLPASEPRHRMSHTLSCGWGVNQKPADSKSLGIPPTLLTGRPSLTARTAPAGRTVPQALTYTQQMLPRVTTPRYTDPAPGSPSRCRDLSTENTDPQDRLGQHPPCLRKHTRWMARLQVQTAAGGGGGGRA